MLSTSACWSARCRLVGTDPRGQRRRSKRRRVRMNTNRPVVWPRRPNGMRRRASAARVLTKGRLSRPTGWMVRLLVLMLIAVPSLMITSPGYVAFADKLPDPSRVATAQPEDTLISATDGTPLLADLHPPGYQHSYEPLSDVGTILAEAVISIEDRNFYQEPGVDPQGVVRATMIDWRARSSVEGASTLTQQLAKLRLVGNAPTVHRQGPEAPLAVRDRPRLTQPQNLQT